MNDIRAKLMEVTGRSEQECSVINDILGDHFIIGNKGKEKIVADFAKKLNLSPEDADELYNKCAEVIAKGIFRK